MESIYSGITIQLILALKHAFLAFPRSAALRSPISSTETSKNFIYCGTTAVYVPVA